MDAFLLWIGARVASRERPPECLPLALVVKHDAPGRDAGFVDLDRSPAGVRGAYRESVDVATVGGSPRCRVAPRAGRVITLGDRRSIRIVITAGMHRETHGAFTCHAILRRDGQGSMEDPTCRSEALHWGRRRSAGKIHRNLAYPRAFGTVDGTVRGMPRIGSFRPRVEGKEDRNGGTSCSFQEGSSGDAAARRTARSFNIRVQRLA